MKLSLASKVAIAVVVAFILLPLVVGSLLLYLELSKYGSFPYWQK